ncbi:DNA helicase [Sphingomonas sp. CL5.1]|uniref:DNA helicase n=1 Tax=Sphingomonas sp. CL5.1 TaxID=2653203 RepID=UPI0015817BD0|nr:DNA helicase [Sphingomonas sp. CL5.1]QKS01777.1 DNA helicase [Sphingomonas sp. CL5.1]
MTLSAPIHRLKRRARLLARDRNIPLHAALDHVARLEGFAAWSLLSATVATNRPLLARLSEGDLLLLAARPGHGKTLLGLRLLIDAARAGKRSVLFTLEFSESQARTHLGALAPDAQAAAIEIVTSDDICADYVIRHLSDASRGTVAVIDYLQILDQHRSKPALGEQIAALHAFARSNGVILTFIAQIDRSYDPAREPLPDLADIRLPNPLDITLFSKACFLHEGRMRFQPLT